MNSLILDLETILYPTPEPTSPKDLSPAHIVPGKHGLEVVLGLDMNAWKMNMNDTQAPLANVGAHAKQAWNPCNDITHNLAAYAGEDPNSSLINRNDTEDVQKISGAWNSLQQKKLQAMRDMYKDESSLNSRSSETASTCEDEAVLPRVPTKLNKARALDESMEKLKKWGVAEDMPTLMMRHVPTRTTQQEILDTLDALGFTDELDFFYLPLKKGQMRNSGYAFVGLRSMEATARFTSAMVGFRFPTRSSERGIEVLPARIQGFGANVGRSRRARNNTRLVNSPFMYGRAAPLRPQTSSP